MYDDRDLTTIDDHVMLAAIDSLRLPQPRHTQPELDDIREREPRDAHAAGDHDDEPATLCGLGLSLTSSVRPPVERSLCHDGARRPWPAGRAGRPVEVERDVRDRLSRIVEEERRLRALLAELELEVLAWKARFASPVGVFPRL